MVMGQPLKYGTPEKRRKMWDNFLAHVSSGLSMKSFPDCDEDTFFSYADRFPEDCPWEELAEARRKGLLFWEKLGVAGTTGKLPGFNPATWIFNMKNRAGWTDKVDSTLTGPNGGSIQIDNKIDITSKLLALMPTEELKAILNENRSDATTD